MPWATVYSVKKTKLLIFLFISYFIVWITVQITHSLWPLLYHYILTQQEQIGYEFLVEMYNMHFSVYIQQYHIFPT